jgi:hypothetical protein
MAHKRVLTDRFLKSLPPAPCGQRVEVWDRLSGFGIRVSDTKDADPARRGKAGRITFVLYSRFTPGAAATRRTIGVYGAMTLDDARRIAGEWRSLIAKGIDPAVIEAERLEKEARERALRIRHSFTIVAEAFIADKLAKERSGKVAERDLRKPSSRHGLTGPSPRLPRPTCGRSSTPRSGPRRRWQAHCWSSSSGSSTG